MSIELLELGADALGDMLSEVTFVGASTMVLWITDPGAPDPMATTDVDVVVEIATLSEYYDFENRLRSLGFRHDDGVIGRWHHGDVLVMDVLPSNASLLLGFDNRWQREAIPDSLEIVLPSGATIKAISPPYLLATKLEAFQSRGAGDFAGSRDFGDIVALVDGRVELEQELKSAPSGLRQYVVEMCTHLFSSQRAVEGIQMHLSSDEGSQARGSRIVLPRIRSICEG